MALNSSIMSESAIFILRLREHDVRKILEFHVPQLWAFDDELMALEIAIVRPPFAIDFAGAYLDQEPDYSPEVWAEWEAEKRERLGRTGARPRRSWQPFAAGAFI